MKKVTAVLMSLAVMLTACGETDNEENTFKQPKQRKNE